MSDLPIVLIEVILVLGSVLAFGFWQLWSLRRDEGDQDSDSDSGSDFEEDGGRR